jgi:hypothetical protein
MARSLTMSWLISVHSRRVEINAFSDACHEELKMY